MGLCSLNAKTVALVDGADNGCLGGIFGRLVELGRESSARPDAILMVPFAVGAKYHLEIDP